MFKIADGRTSFWQWDLGQQLIVGDDVCCEVHFCNGTTDCALIGEVYEQNGQRVVNVPNILLQVANTLHVFAYVKGEGNRSTMHSANFLVLARTKPDDYVYTETEIWTAEKAVADALQVAKESGEFDGYTPQKGIDYYTDADKAEMVAAVLAALPTYNGEVESV